MSQYRKQEQAPSIKFPSIKEVAAELKSNKWWCESGDEGGTDVRLQVYDNGSWALRTGDAQYDLDHSGYWGDSCISLRSNCRDLARELIDGAADHYAQCH